MQHRFASHAFGALLIATSAAASAIPISVLGDSGFSGPNPVPVVVKLNDPATVALEALQVVIEFDTTRLDYLSSSPGSVFPSGASTVSDLAAKASGRVLLSVSSDLLDPIDGASGSLIDVSFNILPFAPIGPAAVTFTCFPLDPNDTVTAQNAGDVCAPDYAIPPTTGFVQVLASATQVPIPGSAWLVVLGLGLMSRTRCVRRSGVSFVPPCASPEPQ